jgi:hypothetical protein
MNHASFVRPARTGASKAALLIVLGLGLALGQGCSGVSEDDLDNLRQENLALEAELEHERRQAEILNRALTSVYKERDRLVDLLNAPPAPAEEELALDEETGPEAAQGQGRVYLVKPGDTLGAIARRNGTTTAVLVTLNPYLRGRDNYMVWENDRIALPR